MEKTEYRMINVNERELSRAYEEAWAEVRNKPCFPSKESELFRKIIDSKDNPFRR